jgi:NAD dependent epimerase/dehydratase family enzyme
MAKETVLSNLAVIPNSLSAHNFDWVYPDLEAALTHALKQ